jgi:hypothetical protein
MRDLVHRKLVYDPLRHLDRITQRLAGVHDEDVTGNHSRQIRAEVVNGCTDVAGLGETTEHADVLHIWQLSEHSRRRCQARRHGIHAYVGRGKFETGSSHEGVHCRLERSVGPVVGSTPETADRSDEHNASGALASQVPAHDSHNDRDVPEVDIVGISPVRVSEIDQWPVLPEADDVDDGVHVAKGCYRNVESALDFRLMSHIGGDRNTGDLGGKLFCQLRIEVDDRHVRASRSQCVRGVTAEALASTDHNGPTSVKPSKRNEVRYGFNEIDHQRGPL